MIKNKIRMEGLTLTVADVQRSAEFYSQNLGFKLEVFAAPHFALLRVGGPTGGTIGLLSWEVAEKEGAEKTTAEQRRSIHVELSTDNLDRLHGELVARGVNFHEPPHDEPWERSMSAFDPDGYTIEFAEGRRGKKTKKKPAKQAKAKPRSARRR